MAFIGRTRELADLQRQLDAVVRDRSGRSVLLRGRRRIGKSRLASEFAQRSGLPTVVFQAARGAPVGHELAELTAAVAASSLPDAGVADGTTPQTLTAALTVLAAALPDDTPSIVILDEVPWLLEQIEGGGGQLQRVWDQRLSNKPVLLLLLGSDVTAMQQLSAPAQAFHGRAVEMVLGALTPRDVGAMAGLDAVDAFDAYLVTGGLPLVVQEWAAGWDLGAFLRASFATSTSALVVAGTRVLDGEFAEASLARQVLTAIGGRGERTFTGISGAARGAPLNGSTLTATLDLLATRGVVVADEPLSLRTATKDRRWRVADPALRFWLAFVEPGLAEVDRGRGDLAEARVAAGFAPWRGRAVEPVVRDALRRLLPDDRWPTVQRVGGWWPRSNNPEIDLVGAAAAAIPFVGTIKWRTSRGIDADDVARLAADAVAVPGADVRTQLVGVCPAGADAAGLQAVWTAEDLLDAWPDV